jgi:hypothetical protein
VSFFWRLSRLDVDAGYFNGGNQKNIGSKSYRPSNWIEKKPLMPGWWEWEVLAAGKKYLRGDFRSSELDGGRRIDVADKLPLQLPFTAEHLGLDEYENRLLLG